MIGTILEILQDACTPTIEFDSQTADQPIVTSNESEGIRADAELSLPNEAKSSLTTEEVKPRITRGALILYLLEIMVSIYLGGETF